MVISGLPGPGSDRSSKRITSVEDDAPSKLRLGPKSVRAPRTRPQPRSVSKGMLVRRHNGEKADGREQAESDSKKTHIQSKEIFPLSLKDMSLESIHPLHLQGSGENLSLCLWRKSAASSERHGMLPRAQMLAMPTVTRNLETITRRSFSIINFHTATATQGKMIMFISEVRLEGGAVAGAKGRSRGWASPLLPEESALCTTLEIVSMQTNPNNYEQHGTGEKKEQRDDCASGERLSDELKLLQDDAGYTHIRVEPRTSVTGRISMIITITRLSLCL